MSVEELDLEEETTASPEEVPAPRRRGRRARADQAPSTSSTADGAVTKRKYTRRGPSDAAVRDSLEQTIGMIAMGLSAVRPLTGMVLLNRAPKTADAIFALAQQNPRLMALLKRMGGISAYGDLAVIAGSVVVAVGVESQAIPLNSPLTTFIRPELVAMGAVDQDGNPIIRPDASNGAAPD